MREERLMILQMLADGKISPDEAEALLDAIDIKKESAHKTSEDKDWRDSFRSFMSGDPFQEEFDTSPKKILAEEDTSLIIKGNLGSFILIGTDDTHISVSGAPRGQYRLSQMNNEVYVKTHRLGGSLTIHVPKTVKKLSAKSNVGRIVAKSLSNRLTDVTIRSHTGQIIVDTKPLVAGSYRIRSHVGKIDFFIPVESACNISAVCKMGAIDTDLPLEIAEQGLGFLKGSLNGGGADIKLLSQMGHIFIGRKEVK